MAISDKTRKILWGRSGNRCAICKQELVIDATEQDDEAVIGDECHVISPKKSGPRHDSTYTKEDLNTYENLILLCRTHHKMVDDQEETYTPDILRRMKTNHENWVAEKLADKSNIPKPIKLCRVKKNIPTYLSRLTMGKQVLDLVLGGYALSIDHDELDSQTEVDLVGGFFQTVRDWADMGDDLEPADRVSAAYDLTNTLQELEVAGFFLFGGSEMQLLEGGVQSEPSDWPVSILQIIRKDNNDIIHMDLGDLSKKNYQPEADGDVGG